MIFLTGKKEKLSLNELEVKSFITTLSGKVVQTLKGGNSIGCPINVSEEANVEGSWRPHTEEGCATADTTC